MKSGLVKWRGGSFISCCLFVSVVNKQMIDQGGGLGPAMLTELQESADSFWDTRCSLFNVFKSPFSE